MGPRPLQKLAEARLFTCAGMAACVRLRAWGCAGVLMRACVLACWRALVRARARACCRAPACVRAVLAGLRASTSTGAPALRYHF